MELKYNEEQIKQMREENAQFESDCLSINDLEQLLMDGCTGWANMDEEDVIQFYEDNVRPQKISEEWA